MSDLACYKLRQAMKDFEKLKPTRLIRMESLSATTHSKIDPLSNWNQTIGYC